MKVIHSRNVNEALILAMQALLDEAVKRDSRNGPVLVFPTPVTTSYFKPTERVLFYPERDANPFFHFMESLWMIAGRNDVQWISQFNSNIENYSDDGVTFHGAYGYRWKHHFDGSFLANGTTTIGAVDQLATIANLLKQNPDDRRTVLQMWDASTDLGMIGKDFPCNLTATFRICPYGKLDMTVFNRSNDMIWGAYGANAVHFSFLQEVMAAWIGVPVGKYWQVSTNFHCYIATYDKHQSVSANTAGFDPYSLGEVTPFPIVNTSIDNWFAELDMFMSAGPMMGYTDPFFKKVVIPMWTAWFEYKRKENPNRIKDAIHFAKEIIAPDWSRACVEWLERRAS